MVAGIVVAIGAVLAGIAFAGIRIGYFFQPTGVLIVLGGTLGVTLITTPRHSLHRAVKSAVALLRTPIEDRMALMEEFVALSKITRSKGLFGIEPLIAQASQSFLR